MRGARRIRLAKSKGRRRSKLLKSATKSRLDGAQTGVIIVTNRLMLLEDSSGHSVVRLGMMLNR
jgi:hypothetical protein